MYTAVLSTK